MAEVIGVRFKSVGKVYYFDPAGLAFQKGDQVIVETSRGVECGEVALPNREVRPEEIVSPLKPVIRMANEQDLRTVDKNRQKEREAFRICQQKIEKHKLVMKLVDVEYTFDNNKILFYFTADGRVDFSGTVEDLAKAMEIELPWDELEELDCDTVGGLVFAQLSVIPDDGSRPVVESMGLRIRVEDLSDRRVNWALIEKLEPEPDEARQEDE